MARSRININRLLPQEDTTIIQGDRYTLVHPNSSSRYSASFCPKLLSGKKKITVLEPHLDDRYDHQFFEFVDYDDVEIEIIAAVKALSTSIKNNIDTFARNLDKILSEKISSFSVNLYVFDESNLKDKQHQWHDRYLITDEEVYLMGTSMSGQINCHQIFGICEIKEIKDKEIIYNFRENLIDLANINGMSYCLNIPDDL